MKSSLNVAEQNSGSSVCTSEFLEKHPLESDNREAKSQLALARAMLVAEFGLEAAFVGVPKLARILGCSPTTIWSYIRQGKFFMPHRLVCGSPVVSVCDLAAWYCSTSEAISPRARSRWPSDAGGLDEPLEPKCSSSLAAPDETSKMVAEVLASMGIKRSRTKRQAQ